MKTKLIGLLILVAVAIVAVAYVGVTQSRQVTEISGFVGGEKIGSAGDLARALSSLDGLCQSWFHRYGHRRCRRSEFSLPV